MPASNASHRAKKVARTYTKKTPVKPCAIARVSHERQNSKNAPLERRKETAALPTRVLVVDAPRSAGVIDCGTFLVTSSGEAVPVVETNSGAEGESVALGLLRHDLHARLDRTRSSAKCDELMEEREAVRRLKNALDRMIVLSAARQDRCRVCGAPPKPKKETDKGHAPPGSRAKYCDSECATFAGNMGRQDLGRFLDEKLKKYYRTRFNPDVWEVAFRRQGRRWDAEITELFKQRKPFPRFDGLTDGEYREALIALFLPKVGTGEMRLETFRRLYYGKPNKRYLGQALSWKRRRWLKAITGLPDRKITDILGDISPSFDETNAALVEGA